MFDGVFGGGGAAFWRRRTGAAAIAFFLLGLFVLTLLGGSGRIGEKFGVVHLLSCAECGRAAFAVSEILRVSC